MRTISKKIWFIGLIGGLSATLIAAITLLNDSLFRAYMDPRIPFQVDNPPPHPDYQNPHSWYLSPLGERGREQSEENLRQPVIFILLPTANYYRGGWNGKTVDREAHARQIDTHIPNIVGPFTELGSLWVPKIRQASIFAFQTHKDEARSAFSLAAQDAKHAFTQFMTQTEDAPILLVGAEQGALLMQAILLEFANDPAFEARFLAAYLTDSALLESHFAENASLGNLSICEFPEATGCVVSFSAHESKDNKSIERFLSRGYSWTEKGPDAVDDRRLVCVNPILWTYTEDYAPARLHKGAVNASGMSLSDNLPPLAGTTSAQCRDGVLLMEKKRNGGFRKGYEFGSKFKPVSYNLFYADIAHNAAQRYNSWIIENTPPPLVEETLEESQINKVPSKINGE